MKDYHVLLVFLGLTAMLAATASSFWFPLLMVAAIAGTLYMVVE